MDIVVLYHPKDRSTIDFCIDGIKQNILYDRILVVTKITEEKIRLSNDVIFVDEASVVNGLRFSTFSHKGPRWGWYFQQILKLGVADLVKSQYYLVIDSDTVFLQPVGFFNSSGKPLYAVGTEYHKPYFETFEKLLKVQPNREYSFITHHMVFNKTIVFEMRGRFSQMANWYDGIVSCQDSPRSHSLFSEYETYGHYIKMFYPGELNLRTLKWANIPLEPSGNLLERLAKYYNYCSFHLYLREDGTRYKRFKRRVKVELGIKKRQMDKVRNRLTVKQEG